MERILVISSELINIDKVRIFLKDVYEEFPLNMRSFNQVFLGISEAVNNAVLHGNNQDPQKNVIIKLNLNGNEMHVEIEDEGDGFCESILFDPTLPASIKCENGRGIFIMQHLADQVYFKENGRKVYIIFTIPQ